MKKILFIVISVLIIPSIVNAKTYYIDKYVETVPEKEETSLTNVFAGTTKIDGKYWYQYKRKLEVDVLDELTDPNMNLLDILTVDFNKKNITVSYDDNIFNKDGEYLIKYTFYDNEYIYFLQHTLNVKLHKETTTTTTKKTEEKEITTTKIVNDTTTTTTKVEDVNINPSTKEISVPKIIKTTKKKNKKITTTKVEDVEEVLVTSDEILPVEPLKKVVDPEIKDSEDNDFLVIGGVILIIVITFIIIKKHKFN